MLASVRVDREAAHTEEVPAWPAASAPAARRPPPSPPPERASPAQRPSAPASSDHRPWAARHRRVGHRRAGYRTTRDRQRRHPQTACRGDRDPLAQSAAARSPRPALARSPANVNAGIVPPPACLRGSSSARPQGETQGPTCLAGCACANTSREEVAAHSSSLVRCGSFDPDERCSCARRRRARTPPRPRARAMGARRPSRVPGGAHQAGWAPSKLAARIRRGRTMSW
jgi:hypothetical protein